MSAGEHYRGAASLEQIVIVWNCLRVPFYDRATQPRSALAADLREFVASGPPPLVFTLGSFAVEFPGDFYWVSLDVARQLQMRAVLLVGSQTERYVTDRSADIFVGDYAPFSDLFPHARAIIHHGGIGSIGQALRAGKPQLVVPILGDQFDNAARLVRLGVARSVGLKQYAHRRVAARLLALISDSRYASRAAELRVAVSREDGGEVVGSVVDTFLIDDKMRQQAAQ